MKRKHWGDKHSPGPEGPAKVVRIEDLMVEQVITVSRSQTVGHARELMTKNGIHCLPVSDGSGHPIGIVTSTDLVEGVADETLVGAVMTRDVQTVPRYADPHIAARVMRNHGIHHLVVTHEQEIVGVLSSFDLLRLVEDRRFVVKNLPSKPKKSTWEKQQRRDEPEAGADPDDAS